MPTTVRPLSVERDATVDLTHALAGCAAGDHAALQRIYDALASRMLGVAVRIVRRRDLAEEIVHDTFLKIWQNAHRFDPARGEPKTWMFTILRHRALNVLRGEVRTDLVDDFEPMGLTADGPDAEAVVTALSESGALRRCLDRLDPRHRNAIVLAYVRGLTHGELAGQLGLPLGTVKSWIRRSLVALKDCMAGQPA